MLQLYGLPQVAGGGQEQLEPRAPTDANRSNVARDREAPSSCDCKHMIETLSQSKPMENILRVLKVAQSMSIMAADVGVTWASWALGVIDSLGFDGRCPGNERDSTRSE